MPERRFDETGDFFEVRRAELRGMEKGRIAPPRASAAVERQPSSWMALSKPIGMNPQHRFIEAFGAGRLRIMAAIEAASASMSSNDAPPLDDRMSAIDASATASSSHMAAIDASATASSSAHAPAPLERFEATVVRWRRLGKRFVFMDVRRDGSAEEWQLSCDADTFAGAERAAVVRVAARDEPNPSKRGLRALRCEAVATVREMGRDEDTKLVVPRDPRDVLCKLWARGACRSPRCPYRHAFATDGERRWSEGAKLRRLAELKREGDARDPWAERAEDASRCVEIDRRFGTSRPNLRSIL